MVRNIGPIPACNSNNLGRLEIHSRKRTLFCMDTPAMSSQANQLHFILFPLMAPGHMIPMIDIAKLLAQRDVSVTIVTTPGNAQRFGKTINRATESGLKIQMLEICFPSVEAGLPEGCENLDSLPSLSMTSNFFIALNSFRQEVEQALSTEVNPKPSCIISDMGLPWTTKIANRFQIPRIVFHGTCCFSLLCYYNVFKSNVSQNINTDTEYFSVPGLPDKIEVTKAQIFGTTNANSSTSKEVTNQIREAEETSYGVIVNSFDELEPNYVEEYRKTRGKKVWCIGPVSLCNVDNLDKAERGNKASIDQQFCLDWLNSRDPRSVIYASFGSLSRISPLQMMELALGLEASNKPFIWAFGKEPKSGELDQLISENGFEERTKDRGLLIRGWAPQVTILSHQAIGGFLTHCGWNSTLEGISAGVPMATWPQFAEQFFNEKLIVQVLKIGVSVGVKLPVKWGEEDKAGILVRRDDVQKALAKLMDEGGGGEDRRRRAKEIGEKAKQAIEHGGSSYNNMTLLIQEFL